MSWPPIANFLDRRLDTGPGPNPTTVAIGKALAMWIPANVYVLPIALELASGVVTGDASAIVDNSDSTSNALAALILTSLAEANGTPSTAANTESWRIFAKALCGRFGAASHVALSGTDYYGRSYALTVPDPVAGGPLVGTGRLTFVGGTDLDTSGMSDYVAIELCTSLGGRALDAIVRFASVYPYHVVSPATLTAPGGGGTIHGVGGLQFPVDANLFKQQARHAA